MTEASPLVNEATASFDDSFVEPIGWQVLVEMPEFKDQVGSLYLPPKTVEAEKRALMVAKIISIGPLAWTGERYMGQSVPYKPGDYVLMAKYSGSAFKQNSTDSDSRKSREVRLVNDDSVLAKVKDPNAVERV